MADYELPRTEDGRINWGRILDDVRNFTKWLSDEENINMLKAIDANARKEEREKCAVRGRIAQLEGGLVDDAIRNREETK